MNCIGICKNEGTYGSDKKLSYSYRYCINCQKCFETLKVFCPCCNCRLRTRARNGRVKPNVHRY